MHVSSIIFLFVFVITPILWCTYTYQLKKHDRHMNGLDKCLLFILYILVFLFIYNMGMIVDEKNSNSSIFIEDEFYTIEECDMIRNIAIKESVIHGWRTDRHKSYPTTDLSVYDIHQYVSNRDNKNVSFIEYMNHTVNNKILPLVSKNFHVPFEQLFMRDLFIVKYDENGQNHLEEHRDHSKISFNLALTQNKEDFSGGGTKIVLLNDTVFINKGDLMMHDSGIIHAGMPVTHGTRYILVGFVNIEYAHWLDTSYWVRSYGDFASCVSFPSAVTPTEMNLPVEIMSKDRSRVCRSYPWVIMHLLQTLSYNTVSAIFLQGGWKGLDTWVVLLLALLVFLLFLVMFSLVLLCLGYDDLFNLVSVRLLYKLNLLSDEEVEFYIADHEGQSFSELPWNDGDGVQNGTNDCDGSINSTNCNNNSLIWYIMASLNTMKLTRARKTE